MHSGDRLLNAKERRNVHTAKEVELQAIRQYEGPGRANHIAEVSCQCPQSTAPPAISDNCERRTRKQVQRREDVLDHDA